MVLDRGSLKRESKVLLKTAQVSPYLFTLVLLAIMFVINGISDYVQMDDEFAYVYSLRFDMDLSFLGAAPGVPRFCGVVRVYRVHAAGRSAQRRCVPVPPGHPSG